MFFIHEKEANSILTKSGLKHLVAVTPSILLRTIYGPNTYCYFFKHLDEIRHL